MEKQYTTNTDQGSSEKEYMKHLHPGSDTGNQVGIKYETYTTFWRTHSTSQKHKFLRLSRETMKIVQSIKSVLCFVFFFTCCGSVDSRIDWELRIWGSCPGICDSVSWGVEYGVEVPESLKKIEKLKVSNTSNTSQWFFWLVFKGF